MVRISSGVQAAAADPPPTAVNDSYTVVLNGSLTVNAAQGVLANDSAPNSDAMNAVLVSGPSSGSLALNPDGSFTYTPNSGFLGTDSFTYEAKDTVTGLVSTPATVTITIASACPGGQKVNVRWHYSANGSSGSWSGTKSTSCQDGSVSIGPQAMEGDLKVAPGTTLKVGYDFTLPGNTSSFTADVSNAAVVFQAACASGAAPSASTFTVAIPNETYSVTNQSWYPSGDQSNPLVYQGSIGVPDLCGGGLVRLNKGGTFTATVLLH